MSKVGVRTGYSFRNVTENKNKILALRIQLKQLGISVGGGHRVSAKTVPHRSFNSFDMRRDYPVTI